MPADSNCHIAMVILRIHLSQVCYAGYQNVLYDDFGRCATKFLAEQYGYVKKIRELWPAARVAELINEVVMVMDPLLKLEHPVRVCYLAKDVERAGMTLRSHPDMIFISPFGVINPMDVVSTTIHELAHLKIIELDHFCGDDHCVVWRECARMLTRAFAVSFQRFIIFIIIHICDSKFVVCHRKILTIQCSLVLCLCHLWCCGLKHATGFSQP